MKKGTSTESPIDTTILDRVSPSSLYKGRKNFVKTSVRHKDCLDLCRKLMIQEIAKGILPSLFFVGMMRRRALFLYAVYYSSL